MMSYDEEIECVEEKSTRFASMCLTVASFELERVAHEWADLEEVGEWSAAEYPCPGLAQVLLTLPVVLQLVARSTSFQVHL